MIQKGLPENVVEADDVCHHTETMDLAALREFGKLTGNWTPYDKEYGRILIERTSPNTIILLASSELARQSGFTIIGRFLLSKDLWSENVKKRGVSTDKYVGNYEVELREEHTMAYSRDELYHLVKQTCICHG